jgi:hypothetical protein
MRQNVSRFFTKIAYLQVMNFIAVKVSSLYTECPKNGVLTVHYGIEETTVNVRKMLKKFYWTYLLIWQFLKVALNR